MKPRIVAVTIVALAVLAAFSCATSSGTLVNRVTAAEGAGEEDKEPPDQGHHHPPKPDQDAVWIKDRYHGTSSLQTEGLTIHTDPDGATVWLNNAYQGTTPLVIHNLRRGTYRLLVTLEGYRDVLVWLDYSGDPMLYEVSLVPVVGFVDVEVTPQDAEVILGALRLRQGTSPVRIGSYAVRVRAFGYEEWRDRITVYENVVTPIKVDLRPAAFAVSPPSISRRVVNPGNPGLLGLLEVGFDVTAPGTGSIAVFDGSRRQIHAAQLPDFLTWSQRWRWRPAQDVPDGDYTLLITAVGRDGVESRQEGTFTIDRTEHIAARAVWSGGAGLLYVPTPDALAAGSLQAALAGIAYYEPSAGVLQAPVLLSIRAGLGDDLEIDALAGAIFTGSTPPLLGSVAFRWAFLRPARPSGVGAALQVKAALQGVPALGVLATDTLANFSGLSLGVPVEVRLGPFALLAEPEIIASAWQVDYDSDPLTAPSPAVWMYWRAGLMFDRGPIVAGASVSVRSLPLPDGLLSFALPIQAGAEFHLLIPDTHVLLGGLLAGEFAGPTEWYLMGGVSLGLLF